MGFGSATAMMDRGSGYIIGVDSDWARYYPEFASIILTSTVKNLNNTVFGYIKDVVDGTPEGNRYIGNLANEGVGLTSFHDLDYKIPENVKDELAEIRELIISEQIEFSIDYQY